LAEREEPGRGNGEDDRGGEKGFPEGSLLSLEEVIGFIGQVGLEIRSGAIGMAAIDSVTPILSLPPVQYLSAIMTFEGHVALSAIAGGSTVVALAAFMGFTAIRGRALRFGLLPIEHLAIFDFGREFQSQFLCGLALHLAQAIAQTSGMIDLAQGEQAHGTREHQVLALRPFARQGIEYDTRLFELALLVEPARLSVAFLLFSPFHVHSSTRLPHHGGSIITVFGDRLAARQ